MKISVQGRNPKSVEDAIRLLRRYDIEISDNPDILISIGGDGTTLYNYKKFRRPILPLRPPDSLGYISDLNVENLEDACKKLQRGL